MDMHRAAVMVASVSLLASTSSWGQCDPGWSAMGVTGNFGLVTALARTPNGALIAGGFFFPNGGSTPSQISRWNGVAWTSLGAAGPNSNVFAILPLPGAPESIIAGGTFSSASVPQTANIAAWNGAAWSSLAGGVNAAVNALARLPSGDVIAGGAFTTAAGFDVVVNKIARWNGISWSPLGTGLDNSAVESLAVMPDGSLIVGGSFSSVSGVPASRIARWDGVAWSPLGAGIAGGGSPSVSALAVLTNGDVVAGGNFLSAGGVNIGQGIARWDGANWNTMNIGQTGVVRALTPLPDGGVIAGGDFFDAGGVRVNFIARWTPDAGGDPGTWSALGSGMNNTVYSLLLLPSGDLIAGGQFTMAGDVPANIIARYRFDPCIADFDCSGSVSSADFFAFLTAFFSSAPAADVNADGAITSQDLFDFLAGFFAGC